MAITSLTTRAHNSDHEPVWTARSNPIFAVLRILSLVLLALVLLACAPIRALQQRRMPRSIIRAWHKGTCQIVGLEPVIHGSPVTDRPVLYVSNHVSYLDIPVLGALLDGCFVAKSEVETWPVFGFLAKLQSTVFIERKTRRSAEQSAAITGRLTKGDSLILFPEGTSSDGNRALRFKSALFQAAEATVNGAQIEVQPISIAYTRFDGMPMGRALRPLYAWYGDMALAPHLWRVLGLGEVQVDVVFHKPVQLQQFASRKEMARHCEAVVSRGLCDALKGRFTAEKKAHRISCSGLDGLFAPPTASHAS